MLTRGRTDLGLGKSENRACDRARCPQVLPSLKVNCRAWCPQCLFSTEHWVLFTLQLLNQKHSWINLVLGRLVCWAELLWIYTMLDENRVLPWSLWFMWYMAYTTSNDKNILQCLPLSYFWFTPKDIKFSLCLYPGKLKHSGICDQERKSIISVPQDQPNITQYLVQIFFLYKLFVKYLEKKT